MIQLQVLNHILRNKDISFLSSNNLDESFFSDYKSEYRYISSHIQTYGNVPDEATFLTQFSNFDVIEVQESPIYLCDALYEDRNKRNLASVFNQVRKLLNEGKTEEAQQIYLNAVDNIVKAKHLSATDILRDKSRFDAYVERGRDLSRFYVTTGFKELDDIIGGWDRNEELATIVARTNMGKSWILLKSAVASAERGLKAGLYSGEMSEMKVGYRADTLIGHLSNKGITHGDVSIQNEYKTYIDGLESKFTGNLFVLTPASAGGSVGINTLRSFIDKYNLDILFIDQHSLLEDDRNARNPIERAANISKDLKYLQVMKRIPIITVSQQNRESTENGVNTTHIAQSDRIGQDSTVVIFFEQKDGVITMTLSKSRDSENGKKIQYAVDLNKGIFTYIPSETDGLSGSQCEDLRREYEGGEDTF